MSFADLTPHGFCLAWEPGLIWLQAVSDTLISLAYFSIPAVLVIFARRRSDLAFRPVFGLFAAFIVACGATHVMGVVTLWLPAYWLDGAIKAVAAALSLATAILLWPLLPRALALPSPGQLHRLNLELARQVEERDAATSRLRDSEAELRTLYARSPAILHAVDAYGTVQEVSDRWLEAFGYGRAEVVGHNVTEFYEPEAAERIHAYGKALRDRVDQPLVVERRLLCKSGELRDVKAVMVPERDERGKLRRTLVALTDITAHKQAEAALRASEDRLRHAQKLEAVGQLTGGIAHDFNNLLTSVMGSLDLLRRRVLLDERGHRLVGNALEGAKRAAALTSQLLTFSRKQHLSPEVLLPLRVVEGIFDLLARSLDERISLVVVPGPPAEWAVLADRNQLEAALLNLVINARDSISAFGEIRISVADRALTQAELDRLSEETLPAGEYVAIEVADTGCGMTEDVRRRAVEPFFTTKPLGAGTGLGLSQSYGFVTQSGGALAIDSAVGAGTRITILLPRTQLPLPEAANEAPTARAERAHGNGECILVVEDDVLLRRTVTDALTETGYRVLEAGTGPEALSVLDQARNVALLFTDVRMPAGMTGVDLAVVARRRYPELRVMFTTGFTDRAVLAGWPERLDLLTKPYEIDELCARLAARLETHRSLSTAK